MIMLALGEDVFFNGIGNYLDDRKYEAAIPTHLFEGLEKPVVGQGILPDGVTMMDVMNSWSTQPGFPVVSVS